MENIVDHFISFQQQFRILHWQTKSYARHKAYGEMYDSFGDLMDEFIETHMGKYGRFQIATSAIQLTDLSDTSAKEFIDNGIEFLVGITEQLDPSRDTDLLNIRDEMLAKMNRLKYLLTLE